MYIYFRLSLISPPSLLFWLGSWYVHLYPWTLLFFPSVFISVCNCLHIQYSTASRVCCSSYLSMEYTILACNMGAGQPAIYRSIESGLRPILFNLIISFSVPLSSWSEIFCIFKNVINSRGIFKQLFKGEFVWYFV